MVDHRARTVPQRRRREGRTDYKKRLQLLLGSKPRMVARLSNGSISAQIISFDVSGDKVVASAHSSALRKVGWKFNLKNFSAAYLVGLLLAKNAKAAGVSEDLVLDTGFVTPKRQGKVYALLKGAIDGGLTVAYGSDKIFPSEDRINGKVLAKYASTLLSENKAAYDKRYSKYVSLGVDPSKMFEAFEAVKKAIGF